MKYLTDEMISLLSPAENPRSFASPVPTQIVSSDEFEPVPQSAQATRGAGAADGH